MDSSHHPERNNSIKQKGEDLKGNWKTLRLLLSNCLKTNCIRLWHSSKDGRYGIQILITNTNITSSHINLEVGLGKYFKKKIKQIKQ